MILVSLTEEQPEHQSREIINHQRCTQASLSTDKGKSLLRRQNIRVYKDAVPPRPLVRFLKRRFGIDVDLTQGAMGKRGVQDSVDNCVLTTDEIGLLAGLIIDEPDHYTALGVNRNASSDDIRSAYSLAVEYFHPLKNRVPETDDVIQWRLSSAWGRLEKAFSILSSQDRRKIYDDHLNSARRPASYIGASAEIEPDRSRPRQGKERNASRSSSAARKESGCATNGNEKRRAERLTLCLPLCVTFENSWREFTHTLDVSPLAIRFYLSRRIKPRSHLRVELPMPKQLRTHNHDDEFYVANASVIYVIQDNCGRQVVAELV